MAKRFRNVYNPIIVGPFLSLIIASGCGGDPPKPPAGAAVQDVDELKASVEGIDLGSEVGAPSQPPAGSDDASTKTPPDATDEPATAPGS